MNLEEVNVVCRLVTNLVIVYDVQNMDNHNINDIISTWVANEDEVLENGNSGNNNVEDDNVEKIENDITMIR